MRKFYTKKIFFIIVSMFWINKIQFFGKNIMYVTQRPLFISASKPNQQHLLHE